jgi:peptidase S41-like protein
MPRFRGAHLFVPMLTALGAAACSGGDHTTLDTAVGSNAAALRDLSKAEASEDLEQIFTNIESLYGPYDFKEAHFGYSIAALEDEARARLAAAPGDDGFYETARWFASRLGDGHVSLTPAPGSNPILTYRIGIVLQPVQGKALVAGLLDPSLAETGLAYGDEVVTVDGVSPFALLDKFTALDSLANDVSNQHLILRTFIRPGFASSIAPTAPAARVLLRRADGSEYSRDLIWTETREEPLDFVSLPEKDSVLRTDSFLARSAVELFAPARGSIAQLGAPVPWFLNAATSAVFDITEVTPNADMLAKYGLDPAALPYVFAALYSYGGRSILLVRQATYEADETVLLNYYRAILDQYDGFADGLVLDQTHNPGGSILYCEDFFRLFTREPARNLVEAIHADRQWVNEFRSIARAIDPTLTTELSRTFELRGSLVEAAYDAGEHLTAPMPLLRDKDLAPDDQYVWTKPLLVLIDELAGSSGDMFPALIKANHTAPLFGQRTMGLGGNVETVDTLTHSAATLNLTRGLVAVHRDSEIYTTEDFIENRGVTPNVPHEITVDDFRSGFLGYVTHFSDQILSQIEAAEAPAPGEPPSSGEPPH